MGFRCLRTTVRLLKVHNYRMSHMPAKDPYAGTALIPIGRLAADGTTAGPPHGTGCHEQDDADDPEPHPTMDGKAP